MQKNDAANLEAMTQAVAYQAAMQNLVVKQLHLEKNARPGNILDFGAGRGDYAVALQQRTSKTVLSFEPDYKLHKHYPADLTVFGELDAIAENSLDAAYSLNVFEHIADDREALVKLLTKCKPGARVFILVPANPQLWSAMDDRVGHHRRYTPQTLRALVQAAGGQVVREGWFDSLGFLATKAFNVVNKLKKPSSPGTISKTQVKLFDIAFKLLEPGLQQIPGSFGKNCWVLLKKPR